MDAGIQASGAAREANRRGMGVQETWVVGCVCAGQAERGGGVGVRGSGGRQGTQVLSPRGVSGGVNDPGAVALHGCVFMAPAYVLIYASFHFMTIT